MREGGSYQFPKATPMDLSSPQSNLLWLTKFTAGLAAVVVVFPVAPVVVGAPALAVVETAVTPPEFEFVPEAEAEEVERALLEPTTPPTIAAMMMASRTLEMMIHFLRFERGDAWATIVATPSSS